MDIIIKESGVAKPLVYMDTATGTECTLDILQMMGAFSNGTITYNEETKQYVAPIDEYNWWKDYLAKKQEEEKGTVRSVRGVRPSRCLPGVYEVSAPAQHR